LGQLRFFIYRWGSFNWRGACGRGRSLFEKSSAKTFLGGTAELCVIFGEKLSLLPQSERNTGKRKRAFFFPYFSRTVRILFACEKNPHENDLDSSRQRVWEKSIEDGRIVFEGIAASLEKSFCGAFFKKRPRCLQRCAHRRRTRYPQLIFGRPPLIFHRIQPRGALEKTVEI